MKNESLGENEHAHDGRVVENVHHVGPGCEGWYAESAHRKNAMSIIHIILSISEPELQTA
jgi:hypothetical protein